VTAEANATPQPAKLRWTNVMPVVPGVYWNASSQTGRIRLVEVLDSGNMTTALHLRTQKGRFDVAEGQWFYGPVQPPPPPKGDF
jgi:hypothetical protein